MRDLSGGSLSRMGLTILTSVALALLVPACENEHSQQSDRATPTPTPTPTPSPILMFSARVDAEPAVMGHERSSSIHIQTAYQSLKVSADYPVLDYNSLTTAGQPSASTRFRVVDNGRVLIDKFIDNAATRVGLVTAEPNHIVAVVDTFSGGAHCCISSVIGDTRSDQGASIASNDWGETGYKPIRSADGKSVVFETADSRAAYAFSSYLGSVFPIQILAYHDGQFIDVTASYPNRLRADADQHWSEYLLDGKTSASPKSALVAYLADNYRLHTQVNAWKKVRRAYADDPPFLLAASKWLTTNGYALASTMQSAQPVSPPSVNLPESSSPVLTETPSQPPTVPSTSANSPDASEFHGFACKGSCVGHERGYRWAEMHEIDDPHTCYTGPRLSQRSNSSFSEGCEAFVDESTGDPRLDESERYAGQ